MRWKRGFADGIRRRLHVDLRRPDVARHRLARAQGSRLSRRHAPGDSALEHHVGDRRAAFAIGAAAEKWAARITNPPSRLDKLGVKPGMTIAAIGIGDPPFLDEVKARGAKLVRAAPTAARPADVIFYGAGHRDALTRLVLLSKAIPPNGAIWIVRPKGKKEITEAETMAAGKRAGLVDVKVVSFSETHTAEKFVIPVARRPRASGR
jgi:hypothetical protein